jgi:hypothetical protein
MSRRRRWLAYAAGLLGAFASMIAVVPAVATTGNNANLPPPEKYVDAKYVDSFLGRFYLSKVPRRAHIMGAQLDIAYVSEEYPEYFFGELQLRTYGSHGTSSSEVEYVYPLEFSNDHLTAGLVIAGSNGKEHPDGVRVGSLSFKDPARDWGYAQKAKELHTLTGMMSLNGGGPYQLEFRRGNDDAPVNARIPTAKQVG